ncbi:hypothetical protein ACOMHN_064373 [Nucella lapillus]
MGVVIFRYAVFVCLVIAVPGTGTSTIEPTDFLKATKAIKFTVIDTDTTTTTTTTTQPPTKPQPLTTTTIPKRPPITTTLPPASGESGGGDSKLVAGIGIGVGVSLCVVGVVVAVVVVVVLWRRGWVLPCHADAASGAGFYLTGGARLIDREVPASPTVAAAAAAPSVQSTADTGGYVEGNHYDGLVVEDLRGGGRHYECLKSLHSQIVPQDAKKKTKNQEKKAAVAAADTSLDPPQTVYQNWGARDQPPTGHPQSSPRPAAAHKGHGDRGAETLTMTAAVGAPTVADPESVSVAMEGVANTAVDNVYENTKFK